MEKEKSEYRASSMSLKRQQTQAIQQRNAIDFCKLLKDCGEYKKEEFDLLVKTTFDSIMKSQTDSADVPEDRPTTIVSTNLSNSARGQSSSDLSDSTAGGSRPTIPSNQTSLVSGQNNNEQEHAVNQNHGDCSGRSSDCTHRNTSSERVMNDTIVLNEDSASSSDDAGLFETEELDTSRSDIQILTQARI